MKEILSKLFSFLKYILLVVAFGLVLFGIMTTYSRLDKSLSEAVEVFIPFAFVLVVFLINIITRSKTISQNLLFNFVSCLVFSVTILICLRAMFDKGMLLYYKYGLKFNPAYFADNLSVIEFMLYLLGGSDIVLLLVELLSKRNDKSVVSEKKEKVVFKEENDKEEEKVESKKTKRQSE